MKLQSIEEITDGMCVFLPNGKQANLSRQDDGVVVTGPDLTRRKYTDYEFNQIIKNGVIIFNEPSQKIMENKIADMNRLEHLSKTGKTAPIRQYALTLLDAMGLGLDVKEEVRKFLEKVDKKEKIHEISDKLANDVHAQRLKNFIDAKNKHGEAIDKFKNLEGNAQEVLDTMDAKEKAGKKLDNNTELMKNREERKNNNMKENDNMSRVSRLAQLTEELKNEINEVSDEMIFGAEPVEAELTDVNDVQMPEPLADTIETDEEGELLTLGKVMEQVKSLKDELMNEINSLKAEIKGAVEEVGTTAEEIKDNVEDVQDDVDDIEDEVEQPQEVVETPEVENEPAVLPAEQPEEAENEPQEEKPEEEEEPEEEEIEKEPKEESLEEDIQNVDSESFKSFLRNGLEFKNEDLNSTKQEIDKMAKEGKDPAKIKDAIAVMSADEKEQTEAEKYAAEKMTESLIQRCRDTKYSSKLNNL